MFKTDFNTLFSYAFRPFYALAALYGSLIILLWHPLHFKGFHRLPDFFWHAHEMIWGYTAAVIVGFLLTAIATWTKTPAVNGKRVLLLVSLWSIARIVIYLPLEYRFLYSLIFSQFFFLFAVIFAARPIFKTHNKRNYLVPVALALLGLVELLFYLGLTRRIMANPLFSLQAGLLVVAAFMSLVGGRVIPLFTKNTTQRPTYRSPFIIMATFLIPIVIAILILLSHTQLVVFPLGVIYAALAYFQLFKSFNRKVLLHPLLWILFVGYFFAVLGVLTASFAYSFNMMRYFTLSNHLIAVGGIGCLTLGMMTRSALGHTGRRIILPPFAVGSYYMVVISVLLRIISTFIPNSNMLLGISGIFFGLALLLFLIIFFPILLGPRQERY